MICIGEREDAKDDIRMRSVSLSDPEFPAIPPMDSEIEDIFSSYGLGTDINVDMDDNTDSDCSDDIYPDTEEVAHKSCIRGILLTGEVSVSLYDRVPSVDE